MASMDWALVWGLQHRRYWTATDRSFTEILHSSESPALEKIRRSNSTGSWAKPCGLAAAGVGMITRRFEVIACNLGEMARIFPG